MEREVIESALKDVMAVALDLDMATHEEYLRRRVAYKRTLAIAAKKLNDALKVPATV